MKLVFILIVASLAVVTLGRDISANPEVVSNDGRNGTLGDNELQTNSSKQFIEQTGHDNEHLIRRKRSICDGTRAVNAITKFCDARYRSHFKCIQHCVLSERCKGGFCDKGSCYCSNYDDLHD